MKRFGPLLLLTFCFVTAGKIADANAADFQIGDHVIVNYIGLNSADVVDVSADGHVLTSAGGVWVRASAVRPLQSVNEITIQTWLDQLLRRPPTVFHKGDEVIVDYIGLNSAKLVDINADGLMLTTAGGVWMPSSAVRKFVPIVSVTNQSKFEMLTGRPGQTFRRDEIVMVDYIGINTGKIIEINEDGLVLTTAGGVWVDQSAIHKK